MLRQAVTLEVQAVALDGDAEVDVQGRWTDATRRKPRSAGRATSRSIFSLGKPASPPPKARTMGLGARLLSNLRSGLPARRNSTGSSGRGTPEVPAAAAATAAAAAAGGAGGSGDAVAYVIDLEAGWPHSVVDEMELAGPSEVSVCSATLPYVSRELQLS